MFSWQFPETLNFFCNVQKSPGTPFLDATLQSLKSVVKSTVNALINEVKKSLLEFFIGHRIVLLTSIISIE